MKARMGAFVDSWLSAQRVAWALLILAIVSGIIGYANQHPGAFDLGEFLRDYYANISTEFASIAITVLIIDGLNRRRDRISEEVREREEERKEKGATHDHCFTTRSAADAPDPERTRMT